MSSLLASFSKAIGRQGPRRRKRRERTQGAEERTIWERAIVSALLVNYGSYRGGTRQSLDSNCKHSTLPMKDGKNHTANWQSFKADILSYGLYSLRNPPSIGCYYSIIIIAEFSYITARSLCLVSLWRWLMMGQSEMTSYSLDSAPYSI